MQDTTKQMQGRILDRNLECAAHVLMSHRLPAVPSPATPFCSSV